MSKFVPKIGNVAIVEKIVGDDIVPEVLVERSRASGGDMTPGDGKEGGDEHVVTFMETSNVA